MASVEPLANTLPSGESDRALTLFLCPWSVPTGFQPGTAQSLINPSIPAEIMVSPPGVNNTPRA